MYYDRTISDDLSGLIKNNGELRWLFDFVKKRTDLDFLIGKNSNNKSSPNEFISIYRGLTSLLTIKLNSNPQKIKISAAEKYQKMSSSMYGVKDITFNFQTQLEEMLDDLSKLGINDPKDQYYTKYDNKKEGYYQNELSRRYGICSKEEDKFVIIDKEAVIGYDNQNEKGNIFGKIRQNYKQLQTEISKIDSQRYGAALCEKPLGNELDFLALDCDGNILLIEYKHGTNTSGIYLSPVQIGLYYEIFNELPKTMLEASVKRMLRQKKDIGLINPKWPEPKKFSNIIPVLIISEYNYDSSGKTKYVEVLDIIRKILGKSFLSNIKTYNYTSKRLNNW